jgi:Neuraminidase (sialidase)
MKRTSLMIMALGLFLFAQAARADWGPAKRLTWTSGQSKFPAIAVDSNKAIHVVWEDGTPGNTEIYYKKSTDGGTTWSAGKRLTWTSDGSYAPAIAVDSSDTIHVVWGEYAPGIEIYYLRSTDGGANWSPIKRLTWTSDWSGNADIALLPDNTIHVVWDDYTPGASEIYYLRSTDGGANWSPAKRLTWNLDDSRNPAIRSGRDIHVVWFDETPGNAEIFYKRSTDGGTTWGAVQRLTWTLSDSYAPAIAIDSKNAVHLVWKDEVAGCHEIFYKSSGDGGTTWTAAKRLTWTALDSYAPAIAVDSNDTLRLVWHDSTPGNYEILGKSSTDGGKTWSSSQRLTSTPGESVWPAIAIDSDNAIHVVWQDDTPGNNEIYYKTGK